MKVKIGPATPQSKDGFQFPCILEHPNSKQIVLALDEKGSGITLFFGKTTVKRLIIEKSFSWPDFPKDWKLSDRPVTLFN